MTDIMKHMDDALILIVFILMSLAFTALGFCALVRPEVIAEYFRGQARPRCGRSGSERIFTRRSMRAAGVSLLVVGPLFVVVGVMGVASLIAMG